jgi:plasmid stabilization system protein ParE
VSTTGGLRSIASATHSFCFLAFTRSSLRPSIWEFIAKDNPFAAKRVRDDILDAICRLVPFPHQGHQRRDLTSQPLRFQTVRNHLIAYTPDEEPLLVLAVPDGRRTPRALATILRGRK